MNKIYKVIWSKARQCYVVTSEFAHSCTKSTRNCAGKSVVAALAALILTTGICAVPAQAADPTLEELYYEQLNSTVHNDETSSPVVKLVEAPTAVPTAAKDGEQAVDNDTQTGEDGGMTGAADQYTVVNEDGFYASNTKGTHNTLSKDGLWVGGTDDNTGFYVDNDGNMRTTENAEIDGNLTVKGDTNLKNTTVDGDFKAKNDAASVMLNEDGASMEANTTYMHVTDGTATVASGTNRLQVSEESGTTVDGDFKAKNDEASVVLNEDGASMEANTTYMHVTDGTATVASGTNRLQVSEESGTTVDGDFKAKNDVASVVLNEDGASMEANTTYMHVTDGTATVASGTNRLQVSEESGTTVDGDFKAKNDEASIVLNEDGASMEANTTYMHVTDGTATVASGTNRLQVSEESGTTVDGDFKAKNNEASIVLNEDGASMEANTTYMHVTDGTATVASGTNRLQVSEKSGTTVDGDFKAKNDEASVVLNEDGASMEANTTYMHVTDGTATVASGTNRLQVSEESGTTVDGDFKAKNDEASIVLNEDGASMEANTTYMHVTDGTATVASGLNRLQVSEESGTTVDGDFKAKNDEASVVLNEDGASMESNATYMHVTDGTATVASGLNRLQVSEESGTTVDGEFQVHGKATVDGQFSAMNGKFVVNEDGTEVKSPLTVQGLTTINADAIVRGDLTAATLQNANKTFTVDEKGNVIAASGTIGGVTLNETRISAAGDKFRVEDDGTMKAVDGQFSGKVTAASGTIGGVTLNETRISAAGDKFRVEDDGTMKAVDGQFSGKVTAASGTIGDVTLNDGKISAADGQFRVEKTGKVTATSGTIGNVTLNDGKISAADGQFRVEKTGKVTATSGTIGNVTLNDGKISAADGQFRVEKTGKVTATSGTIGNVTLNDGKISAANGQFRVEDTGEVKAASGTFTGNVTAADATDFSKDSQQLVTAGQLAEAGIVPGTITNGNGVAIGVNSQTTNGVAIGYYTTSTGGNAVAIGNQSQARGSNSVALGANSIADRNNAVSVGSAGAERQITNVAAGTERTDAANVGQLADAVAGVVKWDSDGNGGYETGHLTSVTEFEANNQVGESITLNEKDGLILWSSGAQGNGTISMNDGTLSLRNGNAENTTFVDVTTNGTTFSQLTDNSKTTISGGNIVTDSVTGLDNTEWKGTTNDESRAATEGQLADLNEVVEDNAKGVVKWDNLDEEAGQIKGVTFAGYGNLEVSDLKFDTLSNKEDTFSVDADGSVSALNGQFVVNEDGMTVTGEDGGSFAINAAGEIAAATAADAASGYVYSFNMNNTEGITLGAEEATMTINDRGATFRGDTTDATTNINADEITTGTVLANSNMYIGTVDDGNAVVTQDQLTDTVGNATDGMVTWDQDPVDHTYQEGSLSSVTNLNVTGNATLQNSNNIFDSEYIALSDNPESRQLQLGSYVTGANDDITLGQITLENGTINMSAGSLSEPSNITEIYVNSDGLTVSTLGNDELSGTDKTIIDGGRISTGTINAANGNFVVYSDGSVESQSKIGAINGEFSNLLHATVGRFDTLQVGTRTGDNFAFYVASDGSVDAANGTFRVYSDGGVRTPWVTGLSNTTWTPDTVEYEGSANAATEAQLAVVDSKAQGNTDVLAGYEAAGITAGSVDGEAEGAIAIGEGAAAINGNSIPNGAIAIGHEATVSMNGAVAIGDGANAVGQNSVALGTGASTTNGGWNSVAIGWGSQATDSYVVSVGSDEYKRRIVNVAAGKDDTDAVNVGQLNTVKNVTDGLSNAGVVAGSVGGVTTSLALGNHSSATGNNSVALGPNATAKVDDAVALGANSLANREGSVSVGNNQIGMQRQITNVADGTYAHDAATVGQIADVLGLEDPNGKGLQIASGPEGYTFKNGAKSVVAGINKNSEAIESLSKGQSDIWSSLDTSNQNLETMMSKASTFAAMTSNVDWNALNSMDLNSLNAVSQISTMSLDVTPTNTIMAVSNQARDPKPGDSNESGNPSGDGSTDIPGLKVDADQISTDRDLNVGGDLSVSGETNLGGSLTVEGDSTFKGDATFEKGASMNGTLNMNGNKITGVADGDVSASSTDAVNGSQLYQVQQDVANNSTAISTLGHKVGELDNRIDEVGAGAAALAALHPLDFDPDNKWDFSAGYGNYRGESAVAFGAFYRPNEDTMFSVGGTVGNDDNMVNAGVSIKIGSGSSGVTTSRVAMAKEIKAMRDVVAKQDVQIQKLTAMVNALVGIQSEPDTTTMFPDVPENHWAYEAVATMAKSGLVKGYPDGEFKGDRTMTRYEFAQIVYNAIQAGAEVDSRLVAEFQPELEYFHIATVAKDKDGNPTIERVRAN